MDLTLLLDLLETLFEAASYYKAISYWQSKRFAPEFSIFIDECRLKATP
jgi:hypothetical protein